MATGGPGQQASPPCSPDWNKEPPVLSPASPSHLTHFKPLTPELDEPPLRSAYSSFVNLFRFSNKGSGHTHRKHKTLLSSTSQVVTLHIAALF